MSGPENLLKSSKRDARAAGEWRSSDIKLVHFRLSPSSGLVVRAPVRGGREARAGTGEGGPNRPLIVICRE